MLQYYYICGHSVMVAHQPLRLDGGLPILGMGSIPIALAKIEKISKSEYNRTKVEEFVMSISDINSLSLSQKIYLMEQLWDSFKQNETQLASPTWHKEVLESRRERYKRGEIKKLSLDEVKASFNR